MKNKLILIGFAILLLIGSSIAYNMYVEWRIQQELRTKSIEFVIKWGNFKDETSDSYLNSIKSYLTAALFENYKESTDEIKKFSASYNLPNESRFEIGNDIIVNKDKEKYIISLTGRRTYVDVKEFDQTVFLTWEKNNKTYLISNIYVDKQE